MHEYLLQMLECPVCHAELDWTITERDARRILTADISCRGCGASYAVQDGIGMFLTPDLPREDLWQQVDSQLAQYLRQNPDLERQLMQSPLDTLAPADVFFRGLVLEERGNYLEAKAVEELANAGLYTPEYLACWRSQVETVIEWLATSDGPIVDLASGRCYLVEKLVRSLDRPIIASDFSPRVLQQDRLRLEAYGLYDPISLLAFDAPRTPFKSGAVKTLTTNLGLPNIQEPGSLLRELRRAVDGTFLAISHFYPEQDEANAAQIRASGLVTLLYREATLEAFTSAGWQVEVENACQGEARPTPSGVILEGAGIDTFPVVETMLEWCVLRAT